MTIASMIFRLLISISVATTLFQPIAGFADSAQSERQNAQAVQFGIFFGGAASQFDQCVQRGLVTAGTRPAAEQASSFMKASIQSTRDTDGFDGSDAVHKGWDIAKQKYTNKIQNIGKTIAMPLENNGTNTSRCTSYSKTFINSGAFAPEADI